MYFLLACIYYQVFQLRRRTNRRMASSHLKFSSNSLTYFHSYCRHYLQNVNRISSVVNIIVKFNVRKKLKLKLTVFTLLHSRSIDFGWILMFRL